MIGTTISDFVSMLHARYRGSLFTSSTMIVCLLAGGRAADAAVERDARVRRRLAEIRPENQFIALEQIDAGPGVVRQVVLQQPNGFGHGGVSRRDAVGDRG